MFFQIEDIKNAHIVEKALAFSENVQDWFPELTIFELRVEVAVRILLLDIVLRIVNDICRQYYWLHESFHLLKVRFMSWPIHVMHSLPPS